MPRDPQRLPDPVHIALDLARELGLQTVAHESPALAFAIIDGTVSAAEMVGGERFGRLLNALRTAAVGLRRSSDLMCEHVLAVYPAALLDAVCRECGVVHESTRALGIDPDTLAFRNGGNATSSLNEFSLQPSATTNTTLWCICSSPLPRAGYCVRCACTIRTVPF